MTGGSVFAKRRVCAQNGALYKHNPHARELFRLNFARIKVFYPKIGFHFSFLRQRLFILSNIPTLSLLDVQSPLDGDFYAFGHITQIFFSDVFMIVAN